MDENIPLIGLLPTKVISSVEYQLSIAGTIEDKPESLIQLIIHQRIKSSKLKL